MKKPLKNPQLLDTEEQDLLDSVEGGEWLPVPPKEEKRIRAFAKEASVNHARKEARINIRLSNSDLTRIKEIAADEGLPYQTLISSLLHKYALGRLVGVSRDIQDRR